MSKYSAKSQRICTYLNFYTPFRTKFMPVQNRDIFYGKNRWFLDFCAKYIKQIFWVFTLGEYTGSIWPIPWSKSFRTRHHVALSFGRFQFFFFCFVDRSVIDVLSDFQLDSLTFVEVTPYCVHLSLCVVSIFHKKKCHRLCSNEFALNFVLKMDLTVRRLWKYRRSVSATL